MLIKIMPTMTMTMTTMMNTSILTVNAIYRGHNLFMVMLFVSWNLIRGIEIILLCQFYEIFCESVVIYGMSDGGGVTYWWCNRPVMSTYDVSVPSSNRCSALSRANKCDAIDNWFGQLPLYLPSEQDRKSSNDSDMYLQWDIWYWLETLMGVCDHTRGSSEALVDVRCFCQNDICRLFMPHQHPNNVWGTNAHF